MLDDCRLRLGAVAIVVVVMVVMITVSVFGCLGTRAR